LNIQNVFDRDNALPSVWDAEGAIPQQGINGTVGLDWKF